MVDLPRERLIVSVSAKLDLRPAESHRASLCIIDQLWCTCFGQLAIIIGIYPIVSYAFHCKIN